MRVSFHHHHEEQGAPVSVPGRTLPERSDKKEECYEDEWYCSWSGDLDRMKGELGKAS